MGNNNLVARVGGELSPSNDIVTGTASSGDTSNWAMMLTPVAGAYAPTIMSDNNGSFSNYHVVPASYIKVAAFSSGTDGSEGSAFTSTYAAYIAPTQPSGVYGGKVKYTLIHPANESSPPEPQPSTAGYINYYANASTAEGTMGRQAAADGDTVTLFASNFSRTGYGFAGWTDAYDYADNPNAHFYGPNEDIIVPTGTTANGLALYAVWIKSAGNFQDTDKVVALCGINGSGGSLSSAIYSDEGDTNESTWSIVASLSSISALTDIRDGETYAIARLSDGKCWMIENLRLADSHQEGVDTMPTLLTTTNTNNPLNDNDPINPTVVLKHNYADVRTFTTLSPASNVAYDADTAPDGWCSTDSSSCNDQSRVRATNTTNRVFYKTTQLMSALAKFYSYGNYYNWYSATAGNGTYGKSSGNALGDICPSG